MMEAGSTADQRINVDGVNTLRCPAFGRPYRSKRHQNHCLGHRQLPPWRFRPHPFRSPVRRARRGPYYRSAHRRRACSSFERAREAVQLHRFYTVGLSSARIPRIKAWKADLKVSHAAIKTFIPFWMSQKQTLDRFVLFPTPLTPTNVMLYGILCWVEDSGEESFVRMESKRSVEVLGVRIRVIDAARAERKAAFVAALNDQYH